VLKVKKRTSVSEIGRNKTDVYRQKVWLRGLIEFSNICSKDCLYCGIRKGTIALRGIP